MFLTLWDLSMYGMKIAQETIAPTIWLKSLAFCATGSREAITMSTTMAAAAAIRTQMYREGKARRRWKKAL